MEWTNFAGDQSCAPARFERPAGRDAVARAVVDAGSASRTVRVAGGGHSFNDAVLTGGTLLSLERMNRILDVDRGSGLVRVEAGVTLGALSAALWDHGLAFPNLGDIDVQSLAGATATGTHGTGERLGNLSTGLNSIELVLADGSALEVSEGSDADAWRAARIGIGSLGVVVATTLATVPAFTLEAVEGTAELEPLLDRIDDVVAANDHFGIFTFPHSDLALTKASNRVDAEAAPRPATLEWFEDVVVTNHVFRGVCSLGRRRPGLIPRLNRLCTRLAGSRTVRDRSYRVFCTPRSVPITEMEYAIPREHTAAAVRAVKSIAELERFDVPVPIEVRFVAGDDAFLSPANGGSRSYIAVHQFAGIEWGRYFGAVEEVLIGFGGRPHWGKRHAQSAATLAPMYPDWERFASVRRRLDPDGRFANPYVRRVLGE
jgi:L-gulonolactone oxidase